MAYSLYTNIFSFVVILGVARVYFVINITLRGSSFSMCSHKPVWMYRDKRKGEFCVMMMNKFTSFKNKSITQYTTHHPPPLLINTLTTFDAQCTLSSAFLCFKTTGEHAQYPNKLAAFQQLNIDIFKLFFTSNFNLNTLYMHQNCTIFFLKDHASIPPKRLTTLFNAYYRPLFVSRYRDMYIYINQTQTGGNITKQSNTDNK